MPGSTPIRALMALGLLAACAAPGAPPLRDRVGDEARLLPAARAALDEGDLGTASQLAARVSRSRPDLDAARVTQAQVLLRSGDAEGARAALDAVLRRDPGNADAALALGEAELVSRRPQAALEAFSRAAAARPDDPVPVNGQGIALDALGRPAEAQARYRAALALDPAFAAASSNLGLSLALSGRHDEAIRILDALARRPDARPRFRQNLALALALAGRDRAASQVGTLDQDSRAFATDLDLYRVLREGAAIPSR